MIIDQVIGLTGFVPRGTKIYKEKCRGKKLLNMQKRRGKQSLNHYGYEDSIEMERKFI